MCYFIASEPKMPPAALRGCVHSYFSEGRGVATSATMAKPRLDFTVGPWKGPGDNGQLTLDLCFEPLGLAPAYTSSISGPSTKLSPNRSFSQSHGGSVDAWGCLFTALSLCLQGAAGKNLGWPKILIRPLKTNPQKHTILSFLEIKKKNSFCQKWAIVQTQSVRPGTDKERQSLENSFSAWVLGHTPAAGQMGGVLSCKGHSRSPWASRRQFWLGDCQLHRQVKPGFLPNCP